MAVSITHDLITLFTGETAFGGAATTTLVPSRYGSICLGLTADRGVATASEAVPSFSLVGKSIYGWYLVPGSVESVDNGGIRMIIGDGTNTRAYFVGGYGTRFFQSGGWGCYVLNGDNLPTLYDQMAGGAQPNLNAITVVGFGFNNPAKAVGGAINCFASIHRVGTGLNVAGGTAGDPGTFQNIYDLDLLTTNAWGIIERMGDGIFSIQGRLNFGSTNAATHFEDRNVQVFFGGARVGNDFFKLTTTGSTSHSNIFRLGSKLGTGEAAVGSDGATISSAGTPYEVNFSNANNIVQLYGSNILGAGGGILLNTNASSEMISCSVIGSGKVNPQSVFFRKNSINATNDNTYTGSALLWNNNINIRECSFNAHAHDTQNPAAIEHTAAGTFTYDALTFSGNDIDVRNLSGGAITINATGGSNPSPVKVTGDTTIVNTVSLTLTGLVEDSRIRLLLHGTDTILAETDSSGTTFQYSYSYSPDTYVDIIVHHIEYVYFRIEGYLLSSQDASIPISQRRDRVYWNP